MNANLISIFQGCKVNGNTITLPNEVLDRDVYVSIKQTFTNNLGNWKGGKTQAFVFDYDPTELLSQLCKGIEVNTKKKFQFFPTPVEVIDFMLQMCIPYEGMRLLEPSAGQGAIVEYAREFAGNLEFPIDAIELNPINRGILLKKGIVPVWDDFMTFPTSNKYDAIIANPPFNIEGVADGYIDHIYKMWEHLAFNGDLVVVAPSGVKYKYSKKIIEFRAWLNRRDGQIYELPKGSFKTSGTMVESVLIKITKEHPNYDGLPKFEEDDRALDKMMMPTLDALYAECDKPTSNQLKLL